VSSLLVVRFAYMTAFYGSSTFLVQLDGAAESSPARSHQAAANTLISPPEMAGR